VTDGDVFHNIPFVLSAEERSSPRIPAWEPVIEKYAKNDGWFQWVIPGRIFVSNSARRSSY
jgi:hypothetical protein